MASYERYKEYASAPAADLAAVNGVFPQGQLVVETDTGKMKVGDGTTAYNSLPFAPSTLNSLTLSGNNGEATLYTQETQTLTAMSGATVSATSIIPANSILLGVTTRVITAITGCTSINIGISGDADAFGAGTAITAGSTTNIADHTVTAPVYYGSAASVVIAAVGGGASFTAGAIRVTAHYIRLTAATS
jgi:hypothetical protein